MNKSNISYKDGELVVGSLVNLKKLEIKLGDLMLVYIKKKDKTVSRCVVSFTPNTVRLEVYKNKLVVDIYRKPDGIIENEIRFLNADRKRANKIKVMEKAQWTNILKLLKDDLVSTVDVLNMSGPYIAEVIKQAVKHS